MANAKMDELLEVHEATIHPHLYFYMKSLRMRMLEYAKEQEPDVSIDMAVFDTYDKEDYTYLLDRLRSISITHYNSEFNMFPEKMESWVGFELLFETVEKAYNNQAPTIKRTCKDCGQEFYIYQQELEFYYLRSLCLPKRCKTCRLKRKFQREITEDDAFVQGPIPSVYQN